MASWFKRNFYVSFFGIFALVGTIMGIVAATIWLQGVRLTNEGVYTTGTVTDLVGSSSGNTRAPVIEFRLENGDRHTYTSSMYSSPPAYDVGERVAMWYNPNNPDDVLLSGLDRWFLPALFGGFFLIFGGIGYGGLFYQWFKKRDVAWLQQNGQAVEATLIGVDHQTNVKMNGASPFVIQCQWLDRVTNQVYVFNSDYIWYDPTEFVQGKTLRVLINPKNPGIYSVDVSFLPESGS